MQDWKALEKELERRGKTRALKKLADSPEGQQIGRMLDAQALAQAVGNGDTAALRKLLGTALSGEDGRRLAQQLRQLMEK
ncbi:MAG: hypothetical protein J6P58_07260 [Oscillospiraceae bacterium]|nr:hypothetical protein [Oscillospiraceae bacterium]